MRTLTRQADELAKDSADNETSTLAQKRQQVDALTTEFKQLAAIAIPLSKQTILFGLYQKSLENWHSEVRGDLKGLFERLLTRLLVLAIFIGIVLIFGVAVKRAIYRYVHEPHRRYQFMLLRKIAMAFAIIIIVALGFASRLDAALTYAGLLTAGIAVDVAKQRFGELAHVAGQLAAFLVGQPKIPVPIDRNAEFAQRAA